MTFISQSDKTRVYERHYEDSVFIPANAEKIFASIDDHAGFSSHMNKSSWVMGGGSFKTEIDAGRSQEIGSHIRMSGKAFGIMLSLDEIVTQREPPLLKTWETTGTPKLLIVDHYRMTVKIEPQKDRSLLRLSMDYNLPKTNAWIGKLFAGIFVKWCVEQMIKAARG